jgi:hypothetical protein
MNKRRKTIRWLRNNLKNFGVVGALGLILASVSFVVSLPPSQVFGRNVNTYLLLNIGIVLGGLIFVAYLVMIALKVYLEFTTYPDIEIREYFVGNKAYIEIKNNEPVALEDVSVKIVDFRWNNSANDVENFSKTKSFSKGLKEINRRIMPNSSPIDVLIANGFDFKFTEFATDDEIHKHIPHMRNSEKSSWNKYDMTFEIYGKFEDEEENKVLGLYRGELVHENYFPQQEKEIIMDNLTWRKFEKLGNKRMLLLSKRR